jgi:TPR repeat protein
MDDWRRKLERRSRARAGWHRTQASSATAEKWVKVAAGILVAIFVVWLVGHDSVVNLHDQEPTMPASSDTDARATDGYELYRRAAYDQAFEQLLPLADRGDGQAQCLAGKILAQGLGSIAADRIEGIKWLDLCIRNPDYEGDDEARDLIDNIINTAGWDIVGEGKYRAFQWQQADINTQNGEPGSASERVLRDLGTMDGDAAFALGADLNNGNNLPVDYAKALECFRRATEFNIPEAAFNLGVSYYAGKGVKAEPKEARHWLQIAADGGFAKAATLLGIMSARGHGTAQDIAASFAYLAQAAKLGDPDAALIKEAIAQGSIPR